MWGPDPADTLAELHAALADRWRLQVLTALCERGEMTHGEMMAHLGLTQPHTSQVLTALRSRGLVYGRRQGRHVYFGLAYPTICEALQALHQVWLAGRARDGRGERPAS